MRTVYLAESDNYLLESHRLMAERILANPELLSFPKKQIQTWLSNNPSWSSRVAIEEWKDLIEPDNLDDLIHAMTRDDDEGQRLRSSSPFGLGILSRQEIDSLFEEAYASIPS